MGDATLSVVTLVAANALPVLDVRAHLAERRRFAPLPPDPARAILPR